MTPKEKAKELVDKISLRFPMASPEYFVLAQSKKCALITVDEVIWQWEYIDTYLADGCGELNPNLKYWYEVKTEIEKL